LFFACSGRGRSQYYVVELDPDSAAEGKMVYRTPGEKGGKKQEAFIEYDYRGDDDCRPSNYCKRDQIKF
jgi:hypothetical protein